MEFKPPHEVILVGIKGHCRTLGRIHQILSHGAPRLSGLGTNISSEIYFKVCEAQETGGLCSLLEVLGQMIISRDDLDKIVAELKEIPHDGYPEILCTAKILEQRVSECQPP